MADLLVERVVVRVAEPTGPADVDITGENEVEGVTASLAVAACVLAGLGSLIPTVGEAETKLIPDADGAGDTDAAEDMIEGCVDVLASELRAGVVEELDSVLGALD